MLACGRAIDADKFAYATIRNMVACIVTGQGAGVAAALAVRGGVRVADVDIGAVQKSLRRQGVRVD